MEVETIENRFLLTLDFKAKTIRSINFVQNNVGSSVLELSIVDGGQLTDPATGLLTGGNAVDITDQVVSIAFLKPDNTLVIQDITTGASILGDPLLGKVQCILMSNTLAAAGVVKAEVSFSKDGNKLSTTQFNFTVSGSLDNGAGVLSSDVIPVIDAQIAAWQTEFDVAESGRVSEFEIIKAQYDAATMENTDIEIVAARGGEVSLPVRLDKADAELVTYKAESATQFIKHEDMKFFETMPSTSQLLVGEYGLVLAEPIIINSYPFNGARNIDVDSPITVNFDIAMDVSTINNANITLNDGTNDVVCLIGYDSINFKAIIIPRPASNRLDVNTFYTLAISNSVQSISGKKMASVFKIAFTTQVTESLLYMNDMMTDCIGTGWVETVGSGTITQGVDHVILNSPLVDPLTTSMYRPHDTTSPLYTMDYVLEIINSDSAARAQFRCVVGAKSFIVGLSNVMAYDVRDPANVSKFIQVGAKTYVHLRIATYSVSNADFWVNGVMVKDLIAGSASGSFVQLLADKSSFKVYSVKTGFGYKGL